MCQTKSLHLLVSRLYSFFHRPSRRARTARSSWLPSLVEFPPKTTPWCLREPNWGNDKQNTPTHPHTHTPTHPHTHTPTHPCAKSAKAHRDADVEEIGRESHHQAKRAEEPTAAQVDLLLPYVVQNVSCFPDLFYFCEYPKKSYVFWICSIFCSFLGCFL